MDKYLNTKQHNSLDPLQESVCDTALLWTQSLYLEINTVVTYLTFISANSSVEIKLYFFDFECNKQTERACEGERDSVIQTAAVPVSNELDSWEQNILSSHPSLFLF